MKRIVTDKNLNIICLHLFDHHLSCGPFVIWKQNEMITIIDE